MVNQSLFSDIKTAPARPLSKHNILHNLTNINVEYWMHEGLFARGRIYDENMAVVDISVGQKMRFCQKIISMWFAAGGRDPAEGRGGAPRPRQEILADNHMKIRKMFAACKNQGAAAAALAFIVRDYPVGAMYYAKHVLHVRWKMFKDDFNDVLNEVMAGAKHAK
jgi:hypothetical protein